MIKQRTLLQYAETSKLEALNATSFFVKLDRLGRPKPGTKLFKNFSVDHATFQVA